MGGLGHVARRRRLCADLFAVDDFREAVRPCCSASPRHLANPPATMHAIRHLEVEV